MALDWYWLDGSAYCPDCVECDTPAIDAAAATRGPKTDGCCACCGTRAGGYYVLADMNPPCIRCLLADRDRVVSIAPRSPLVKRFATFDEAYDYPACVPASLELKPLFISEATNEPF